MMRTHQVMLFVFHLVRGLGSKFHCLLPTFTSVSLSLLSLSVCVYVCADASGSTPGSRSSSGMDQRSSPGLAHRSAARPSVVTLIDELTQVEKQVRVIH